MITEFDDKGKIFTNVIPKKPVSALIQTASYRIEGDLYVAPGERIKDELNSSHEFIALTDARIFDLAGKELYTTKFLSLNKTAIIWLIPLHELVDKDNPGGKA